MDDIAKSISALDDVIALFDDTSLPYMNDEEVINCNEVSIQPKVDDESSRVEEVVHTSDFHRHQEDITNCNRFTSQFSTELLGGGTSEQIYSKKFLSSPDSSTGSSGGKKSKVKKSGDETREGQPSCGGASGTYSKGTGYEVRLPRIPPSETCKEGASQKAAGRPELSRGVFSSLSESSRWVVEESCVPNEPEVDYNTEDSLVNNNGAYPVPLGSLGKVSSSIKQVVSGGGSKEQWNFPSEKNLPRSLRKTRKTCLIEDEEGKQGDSSEGDSSSIPGGVNGEKVASSHDNDTMSSSSCSQHSSPSGDRIRESKGTAIYEELVAAPRLSKSNHVSHENSQHSYSSSSSLSFNSSSAETGPGGVVVVVPKPKVRQLIPGKSSATPPPPQQGKVPKPNPKPGIAVNANRTELSSTPLSLQVEMSRVGDEGGGRGETGNVAKKIKSYGSLGSSGSPEVPEDDEEGFDEVQVQVNNGQGAMMRMMMMMKPSAKANNSTGSASSVSISRSSSSSSGGDPNYYSNRKDNLSSSSGIVVTSTSSSCTASTASPTNSSSLGNKNVINEISNNNVTIISTPGKVSSESGGERKVGVNRRIAGPVGVSCHPVGVNGVGNNNKSLGVGGGANVGTTCTPGVLDVDDGYLSMINRNEAPLLWPEEFIENETFSADELKRLSVHLPTDYSDEEESCSEEGQQMMKEDEEIELEIVDYEREPSRRTPQQQYSNQRSIKLPGSHRNKSTPSCSSGGASGSSAPINRTRSRDTNSSGGLDKTDYFSDDSLEGESEESFEQRGDRSNAFYKNGGSSKELFGVKNCGAYHQNIIVVNHGAMISPGGRGGSKSQASRIPKMVSSKGSRSCSSARCSPAKESVSPVMRKPCTFFVPLSDSGSGDGGEVNDSRKSSSLPKGSRVAISSPVKRSSASNTTSEPLTISPHLPSSSPPPTATDRLEQRVDNSCPTKIPVVSCNPTSNSSKSYLPQLRHTKSINGGGARGGASNADGVNANKRKSTSDLVVVGGTVIVPEETVKVDGRIIGSFNRTATFLIPCSRNAKVAEGKEEEVKDDNETDNDEDDLSSDFDVISSTEPDSLQPLSMDDVHDFVSEIMDTAIRHELTQRNLISNEDYFLSPINISELTEGGGEECGAPEVIIKSIKSSVISLPGDVDLSSGKMSENVEESSDTNCPKTTLIVEEGCVGESADERADLAEQLEAVVTLFLSDNESFLKKDEEEVGGDNETQSAKEHHDSLSSRLPQSESQKDDQLQEAENLATSTVPTDDAIMPEVSEEVVVVVRMPCTDSNGAAGAAAAALRDSSLLGEEKILDEFEEDDDEVDEELPPAFIPTPPPKVMIGSNEGSGSVVPPQPPSSFSSAIVMQPQNNYLSETRFGSGKMSSNNMTNHLHHHHNSNVREGKAALDLLAERISNSKKFSSPEEQQLAVSHFVHDKRNIWGWYDRPYEYDEELLTVNSGGRGYASRSQENLVDAMTKERFQKSFSARGQSSTLPLNCRPPTTQRRSSTFRNMFNKFRRNKQTETSMKEIPEYHRDDEVQSITSRETGASETSKKRGFFSRLFRRSKKH